MFSPGPGPESSNDAESEQLAAPRGELEVFMRRAAKPLFRYLSRYVVDPNVADDLAQDTMKSLLSDPSFDPAHPRALAYAYRAAHYVLLNHLQSLGGMKSLQGAGGPWSDKFFEKIEAPQNEEPIERALVKDIEEKVGAVLARQRERYREVLRRRYFEDLPDRQVRTDMGISKSIVAAARWDFERRACEMFGQVLRNWERERPERPLPPYATGVPLRLYRQRPKLRDLEDL